MIDKKLFKTYSSFKSQKVKKRKPDLYYIYTVFKLKTWNMTYLNQFLSFSDRFEKEHP